MRQASNWTGDAGSGTGAVATAEQPARLAGCSVIRRSLSRELTMAAPALLHDARTSVRISDEGLLHGGCEALDILAAWPRDLPVGDDYPIGKPEWRKEHDPYTIRRPEA
jgi:hypothetical protein